MGRYSKPVSLNSGHAKAIPKQNGLYNIGFNRGGSFTTMYTGSGDLHKRFLSHASGSGNKHVAEYIKQHDRNNLTFRYQANPNYKSAEARKLEHGIGAGSANPWNERKETSKTGTCFQSGKSELGLWTGSGNPWNHMKGTANFGTHFGAGNLDRGILAGSYNPWNERSATTNFRTLLGAGNLDRGFQARSYNSWNERNATANFSTLFGAGGINGTHGEQQNTTSPYSTHYTAWSTYRY